MCVCEDGLSIAYRYFLYFFFFSSRRRHTRFKCDWSSDVCSSDLLHRIAIPPRLATRRSGRPDWRVASLGGIAILCSLLVGALQILPAQEYGRLADRKSVV